MVRLYFLINNGRHNKIYRNPNPTEKSMIQKKKIMLHKTKEHATDVIPNPPVESWEKSFDEKFIMPEEHLGKDYWQGGYTPRVWGKYQDMVEIKKFISSQIQQAEERGYKQGKIDGIESCNMKIFAIDTKKFTLKEKK